MKLDILIDDHQRKCRVQAKVPECPSVWPSGVICLILWMHALFFHDFYILLKILS